MSIDRFLRMMVDQNLDSEWVLITVSQVAAWSQKGEKGENSSWKCQFRSYNPCKVKVIGKAVIGTGSWFLAEIN